MNLNQDRTLNYINSFRLDEKYTDTVLKFSDGHIYVHWMILEAHGSIWWTLARDTNCDNIVEVNLPEVSLAEGLIFVEEVYSSIHSFKALNPISVQTVQVQNPPLLLDNNNNTSYDLDIENDPAVAKPPANPELWPRTVKNQLFDEQTRFELEVVLCRCLCELSESEIRI